MAGLVSVRRFVCARADAVADRMARLSRIAHLRPVARASPCPARPGCHRPKGTSRCTCTPHQVVLELGVSRVELADDQVLRVVAPVAVGADPDLEERRLVLLRRPAPGRGERADAGPVQTSENPHASSTFPSEAGAVLVHPAVPGGRDLALASFPARSAPGRAPSRRRRSRSRAASARPPAPS